MSFKDVRDLGEHLKLLGFPKVFPLQALATNFGSLASFHVVAEVLQWLAGLLEPGTILSGGVQSEVDRVLLIRSATEFFVTKSAIKLNPRKLYAASAVTASELQKITSLLIAPIQQDDQNEEEESNNYRSLNQVDIGDKIEDLRRARELSSDLTLRGAALHDLLAKEMSNRETRLAQANRPMELSSVERSLKNAINAAQVKLQSSKAQLENAKVEMNALNSKLLRKKGELERTKQRLEALQKIRPAHMQEFEECEKEMKDLFQKYFLRLHVRDALRAQCEARNKRAIPSESPILQKPNENSMTFIPEGLTGDDDEESDLSDIRDEDLLTGDFIENIRPSGSTKSKIRPSISRNRKTTDSGQRERTGRDAPASSMLSTRTGRSTGNRLAKDRLSNDNESSFASSDSDFDMAQIMSNNPVAANMGPEVTGVADDDFDLNSMEDISISKITGDLPLRPKTASKPEHHSDEDF